MPQPCHVGGTVVHRMAIEVKNEGANFQSWFNFLGVHLRISMGIIWYNHGYECPINSKPYNLLYTMVVYHFITGTAPPK